MSGQKRLSLVKGPLEPALPSWTMGQLLSRQATRYPSHLAAVSYNARSRVSYTYEQLNEKTATIAHALIARGVKRGDRIGFFIFNGEGFLEIYLAVVRIGAVAVLFHNLFAPTECVRAASSTGCSILFTSTRIGERDTSSCLVALHSMSESDGSSLKDIVLLRQTDDDHSLSLGDRFHTYDDYIHGSTDQVSLSAFQEIESNVSVEDVCIFHFTSGTTGNPKIAMLTHRNIIGNGFLTGNHVGLTDQDVLCTALGLYNSGGIMISLMSCLTHASTFVIPSPAFNAGDLIHSLTQEACTAYMGTPTTWIRMLERYHEEQGQPGWINLHKGIIGGSTVTPGLVARLKREFGVPHLAVAYGMTETAPLSFISPMDDQERLDLSLWQILPHTSAKIVDATGQLVPRGDPGELCIAGYLLQKGYYGDPEKTRDAMRQDDAGTTWMLTGDEAVIDEQGLCRVTGRIKEMVKVGGETIHPGEIESRLSEHPAVLHACVAPLHDARMGEVVSAFLESIPDLLDRPSVAELQNWVRQTLAAHKVPSWIFWVGDEGSLAELPLTASGKVKKHELTALGSKLVAGNLPN
ncbi:hypothetical protein BDV25DRAFT_169301 [Aspergillus avenaceus]|uniref:Acetyl-CoA synthetase-like protein n=1 Tax=Aspergillus avenaceus TaxID=36643 RepID=A0A5N6U954_ASPAV|nr:hypothetical protein BDV25DRAFT_169301 [Aspergillus avenaceus]